MKMDAGRVRGQRHNLEMPNSTSTWFLNLQFKFSSQYGPWKLFQQ